MQPAHTDPSVTTQPHPNDTQALRAYTETYEYDEVGNILAMLHAASGHNWNRHYTYASANNKLATTEMPGDPSGGPYAGAYDHDARGNMIAMPHLAAVGWDWADRMQTADLGGGGDVYFAYDSSGQRVWKVWQKTSTLRDERIYLGGYEIFRSSTSGSIDTERETLHVMDDQRRVAMVETLTISSGSPVGSPTSRQRYQVGNQLESVAVELTETGAVISYEEYFPFGATSFHSANGSIDVSAKRYRYTGKERDDETGLYYHGARYYAAWLGRWTAVDPSGRTSGSRYAYVGNHPIQASDPDGREETNRSVQPAASGGHSSNPDDPLNYPTLEDWKSVAHGPLSNKAQEDIWTKAHNEATAATAAALPKAAAPSVPKSTRQETPTEAFVDEAVGVEVGGIKQQAGPLLEVYRRIGEGDAGGALEAYGSAWWHHYNPLAVAFGIGQGLVESVRTVKREAARGDTGDESDVEAARSGARELVAFSNLALFFLGARAGEPATRSLSEVAGDVEGGIPGRLGIGAELVAHVEGSSGLMASLGTDAILDLYIKKGPNTPSGAAMFNEALNAYGSNVKGVRGTWLGGGDLADNFNSFKAATAAGLSPEAAAFQTFTGKMSQRAGFTSARIVSNEAGKVVVEFTK